MKDYQLFQLIKPVIDAGLAAGGVVVGANPVVLSQSYQPTLQGAELITQVFMQKLGSKRFGWPRKYDVWNVGTGQFDHYEEQIVESTFQVGALTVMTPSNLTQLSANDILDIIAATMQSDATIVTLNASSIGILRVTDIQNPFFKNERDQYQSSPSFDMTLTHKQVTITATPKVDTFTSAFLPV